VEDTYYIRKGSLRKRPESQSRTIDRLSTPSTKKKKKKMGKGTDEEKGSRIETIGI